MRAATRTVFLVAVLLVIAIAGAAVAGESPYRALQGNQLFKKGSDYTELIDVLFDVNQGGELLLGTTNGSVKINTWSKDQIRLVITKTTNAATPFNARTILEDFLVQTRHQGKTFHLLAEANTEACKNSVGVSFTVWVPENYRVNVETGDGNVDIGKLTGTFSAKTANGKITFECDPNGMDIEVEDKTGASAKDKPLTEDNAGNVEPNNEKPDPPLQDKRVGDSASGSL